MELVLSRHAVIHKGLPRNFFYIVYRLFYFLCFASLELLVPLTVNHLLYLVIFVREICIFLSFLLPKKMFSDYDNVRNMDQDGELLI